MSRPPVPGVPGRSLSPHLPVGRVTFPLLWVAALEAAQPCGVSLATGGIAPASLPYDPLSPVARVAGPCCLAGDALLGCVPAGLASVVAMAPGYVCHGPRRSQAVLRPVALEYRSCHWSGGSAASPQCVQPWGCGSLCPVPPPPSLRARVRCPWPLDACSPVRGPVVFLARCPWTLGACSLVRALCAVRVCGWWLRSGPPPSSFFLPLFVFLFLCALVLLCVLCIDDFLCFLAFPSPPLLFFFFLNRKYQMKKGVRAHCRHRHEHLVQQCSSAWFFVVVCIVGALTAGAPQGCSLRVLMYTGAG